MSDVPDAKLDEPICVVPCHKAWASEAHEQAKQVRSVLGDLARDVLHIGSTAVPGLAAKPVLDLAAAVNIDQHETAAQALSAQGFDDFGAAGVPGRRYLRRRAPRPAVNVQLMTPAWRRLEQQPAAP